MYTLTEEVPYCSIFFTFHVASGPLTPGVNGQESTWKVKNIEQYGTSSVKVYNRNGQLVFSKRNYQNDWGGTYQETGELLPAGSYYYLIEVQETGKVKHIEQYGTSSVKVYNRNGQLVFSKRNYQNDWGGTYQETGELLPAGSYYYLIEVQETGKVKKGWLYLTY